MMTRRTSCVYAPGRKKLCLKKPHKSLDKKPCQLFRPFVPLLDLS